MIITSEASEPREELAEKSEPEGKLNLGEVKYSRTPVLLRLFLEYWVQL